MGWGKESRYSISPTNKPTSLITCNLALLLPSLESCVPHSFQVWGHQVESCSECCDLQADGLSPLALQPKERGRELLVRKASPSPSVLGVPGCPLRSV